MSQMVYPKHTPPEKRTIRRFLYLEFWWAVHNLVAHPLSQMLWWASFCGTITTLARCSDWVHDATVPQHQPDEGRG